jgi:hypothetical protein
MGFDAWIAILGCVGTLMLVLIGFLNWSIFSKQLALAKEQIATAVRQLEIAQKAPDLQLIHRAIAESSDHVKVLVDRPYLRPYLYDGAVWKEGDRATADEVKLMAEMVLNSFASTLMHSAAFPQYPVRGIDRIISFHLRHSPSLTEFLWRHFDRFPFTGLTLLCLKNEDAKGVVADLLELAGVPGIDAREVNRRTELMRLFEREQGRDPIQFAALTMQQRQ